MPHKINVSLVALAAIVATMLALAESSMDRRASMGFMGMRGKKDDQPVVGSGGPDDSSSAAVELDKRTLVFRRPLFGNRRSEVNGPGSTAEGFKRAMGFVGMRGKKEYYKGSAAAGFFGMRGKKVPSADSFFGVRGKKWPEMDLSQPQYGGYADDADVEQAVYDLHRIIDNLRSDKGERKPI